MRDGLLGIRLAGLAASQGLIPRVSAKVCIQSGADFESGRAVRVACATDIGTGEEVRPVCTLLRAAPCHLHDQAPERSPRSR